jgi:hypothetical protein
LVDDGFSEPATGQFFYLVVLISAPINTLPAWTSNRVKGRDWYDMEWHLRNNTPLNLEHFCQWAIQSDPNFPDQISPDSLREMLNDKIQNTNNEIVKNDVRPFLKNSDEMKIWSAGYFLRLVDRIVIK